MVILRVRVRIWVRLMVRVRVRVRVMVGVGLSGRVVLRKGDSPGYLSFLVQTEKKPGRDFLRGFSPGDSPADLIAGLVPRQLLQRFVHITVRVGFSRFL